LISNSFQGLLIKPKDFSEVTLRTICSSEKDCRIRQRAQSSNFRMLTPAHKQTTCRYCNVLFNSTRMCVGELFPRIFSSRLKHVKEEIACDFPAHCNRISWPQDLFDQNVPAFSLTAILRVSLGKRILYDVPRSAFGSPR
jgi:hypothetical protein